MKKHPLANCENCPLREASYVPSKIVAEGKYVVLAEAPAHNEVRLGEPLVGQSGKLLNATFRNLGVDPKTISKLNAVSCFCEPGKAPPAKAIECCKPRLEYELAETSGPIMALGNSAVRALFGKSAKPPISKLRGTNDTYKGKPIVFTYHPAATMRSPHLLRVFEGDIRNLISDADRLEITDIKYTRYEELKDLVDLFGWLRACPEGVVAYDIETNWKQWYEFGGKITSLSLSPSTFESHVIDGALLYRSDVKEKLNAFFKKVFPIAHNAKFDEPYLRSIGIEVHTEADTMLQSNVLNEYKQNHGLKELANQYLGIGAYKHIAQTDIALYNAIDTATTMGIYHEQKKLIEKEGMNAVSEMLMEYHWLLTRVESHGIKLDLVKLQQLKVDLTKELADLKRSLQQFIMQQLKDVNLEIMYPPPSAAWSKGVGHYRDTVMTAIFQFNPGSYIHMQILLYDILKLKAVGEWPKGEKERSTGEAVLHVLEKHPILEKILDYRKHEKILKTYVNKFLTKADGKGYLHPDFIIGGTETGRLSARDAIHSLPRNSTELGKRLRSTLVCEDDEVIIAGDYSQIELRIFAVEANVRFLLDAYARGADVHNEVVEMLATYLYFDLGLNLDNPNHREEARVLIKGFNFGSIYGAELPTLASTVGIAKHVLEPVYKEYHKNMPEIKLYALKQLQKVYKYGYVQSRFGRKRRFYNISSFNKGDIQREAANAPTQGSASDVTMHAAQRLQKTGFQVIHLLHDGIYTVVPACERGVKEKQMQQIMIDTAKQFYPEVPWKADISSGTSFASLEKVIWNN